MDIMMPIMDGYATIRAIRAIDRFSSLPIIAVTGKVMPGERQRCLDAGANDFVPKPIDTAELLGALRAVDADHRTLHRMSGPGPCSGPATNRRRTGGDASAPVSRYWWSTTMPESAWP